MLRSHTVAALALGMASLAFASEARAQGLPPLPPPPQYGPPSLPPPPAPPARRPPPPSAPPQDVELRFVPDEPDVALLSRSGEMPYARIEPYGYGWYYERGVVPLYSPICEGPCATTVQPGAYDLALSKGGGRAVPVHASVVLQRPTEIRAHYVDRSGTRALGAVIGIVGTVGGIIMTIASVRSVTDYCDAYGYCYGHDEADGPLLAGGIGVLVGSLVVGSVLALQRDRALLRLTPLALAPMREEGRAPAAQGAALTLTF